MRTIDEYVEAVEDRIPRWHPGRREIAVDLRTHLSDRVIAGEDEAVAVSGMEDPERYAARLMEGFELSPAPLARRVGAFLIDIMLGTPVAIIGFTLFFALISTLVSDLRDLPATWLEMILQLASTDFLFVAVAIIFGLTGLSAFVLSIVYFPVAEALWGTTIGKRLMGLGVVAEDGTRIGWVKAIVRRLPFYFEFFWIDSIFALVGKRRQRAFDHVAGTWVVRCPR